MQKVILILLFILVIICAILSLCSGCKNQPVITGTKDIEQLRYEYQLLRNEYDKLQSDYSRFIEENKFYAEYYRNTTAAIEQGIQKLNELGNGQFTEISTLRTNIAILRNIIQSIIDGQSNER